jgi:hypothetical protein
MGETIHEISGSRETGDHPACSMWIGQWRCLTDHRSCFSNHALNNLACSALKDLNIRKLIFENADQTNGGGLQRFDFQILK